MPHFVAPPGNPSGIATGIYRRVLTPSGWQLQPVIMFVSPGTWDRLLDLEQLAGDVVGGWILGRQALAAAGSDDPWLQSKRALARVYASQVLALTPGLADAIAETDANDLESTPAAALAG